MGLNDTLNADRIHIGIFGRRNAGKSSILNALTGQDFAIVSDIKGTTTDPVYKAMELLPLGPIVIIDTPGLDDDSELGASRIKKGYQILNKTDIALIIIDASTGISTSDYELIKIIEDKKIPFILVYNKADLMDDIIPAFTDTFEKTTKNLNADNNPKLTLDLTAIQNHIYVSTITGLHIHELKELIAAKCQKSESKLRIVADLISPSDFVVLVVPIDKAAPKGRLILPQQQTIRDILEADATAIVVKEYELRETLATLGKKPKLVITDSQVFAKVSADTPNDILLTSFSILFARYKGDLETVVQGAKVVDTLVDGDTILISEGCSHHRQCDDIGTVKLPRWIAQYTGKQLNYSFTSGSEFPEDLSAYKLIVHCGGCMLNEREMKYRLASASDANIPITNYGILIAYLQGILKRSVQLFPPIYEMLCCEEDFSC